MTNKERILLLHVTLDCKWPDYLILQDDWHSEECVTLWLLADGDKYIHCRMNLSLDHRWSLVPLEGVTVGEDLTL